MAQKVIIDLEAKTDAAVKEIADLKKEISKLNQEVAAGNKDTKDGLKGVENASNKTAGGVKKIGGALKAAGIGLAIAAFAKFTEVLNQNQKVTDFFSITFETLSLAFNDFFNFILSNTSSITGFFKAIFDDPLKSIKGLGSAIKNNIIERFNSMLDTVGLAGKAVKKFFEGDFSGASEAAKEASKEFVDVLTGVDGSVDKVGEGISKVADATTSYVKETIKAATENVNLAKTAELAAVENQGLIEKYDLQAEKLRQVRDEERNSIADRIKANNDLKAVLDEQEKAMLANANAILNAAQAQFDKNGNDENQIALKEAQNELLAVEAQIAGFRSEQKANDLALDRESIELTNSKLESESKLSIEQKRFNAEQIEDELARLEALKKVDILEAEQEAIRLQAIIDNANAGTQAKVDAQIALDEFTEQSRQLNITRTKEIAAQKKVIDDKELADKKLIEKQKLMVVGDTFAAIAGILGESSKAGKAFATGQALINTYLGVTEVLGTKSVLPEPFATISRIASIATVLATGLKTVKQINSVQPMQTSGAGISSGGGSAPATPSAPPAFNVVGTSGANQLAGAIASQQQQPVKAFVVSNDVTTAQELDRNIVSGATIG